MQTPLSSDPVKHFGFPECGTCFKKPCSSLRAGIFSSDRYIFVHRSYYTYTDCVFAVKSFWEVESYLKSISNFKLKSIYDSITCGLRISEQLSYNQNHFFNTYSEINGYIDFLRVL